MSPILKKYVPLAALFLCACTLWNCGNHSTDSTTASATVEGNTANVSLRLDYSTPPLLDSLVLDCYGTDTLHYVHSADNPNFSLELFPSDSWNFKAKIYANGALMQMGELETKLSAGTAVNLSIQMHPVVGFVFVGELYLSHHESLILTIKLIHLEYVFSDLNKVTGLVDHTWLTEFHKILCL